MRKCLLTAYCAVYSSKGETLKLQGLCSKESVYGLHQAVVQCLEFPGVRRKRPLLTQNQNKGRAMPVFTRRHGPFCIFHIRFLLRSLHFWHNGGASVLKNMPKDAVARWGRKKVRSLHLAVSPTRRFPGLCGRRECILRYRGDGHHGGGGLHPGRGRRAHSQPAGIPWRLCRRSRRPG